MAFQVLPERKSEIINLKNKGDIFKGWITSSHEGKFGRLYDGFDVNGKAVSIQSTPDLEGRMQFYTFGCYVEISIEGREKLNSGNEYKKYFVRMDDDPFYSWDKAKNAFLKANKDTDTPDVQPEDTNHNAEDTPF